MFTDKDFKDLYFPIHKSKVIWNEPKIKALDIPDIPNKDKVIRYLVYMYDENTPLIKERDLFNRKKMAAKLAGFKSPKDKKLFMDLAEFKSEEYVRILFNMLKAQRNMLWCKIVSNEAFFFECNESLLTELSGDDGEKKTLESLQKKAALAKEMDVIHARLKGYYNELAASDEQVEEVIRTNSFSPEARILGNA